MGLCFGLGALCFGVAGAAAQWTSAPTSDWTRLQFVGSLSFTLAAYLQWAEAVNAARGLVDPGRVRHWRPASWEPRRIDWLSTAIQLAGTVLFNVSTWAALARGLSATQDDAAVWLPDVCGCVAFLVASQLALAERCHRWFCLRRRTLSWWIAVNLAGSVAFAVSAVASLALPPADGLVDPSVANLGTALGGLLFLLGAAGLLPEADELASAGAAGSTSAARAG